MGRPKGSKNKPKLTVEQQNLKQDVELAGDDSKRGRQLQPAPKKKTGVMRYFSCNSGGCDATILVTFPIQKVGDSAKVTFTCEKCKTPYTIRGSVKLVLQDV
jgi:hypothetical protein